MTMFKRLTWLLFVALFILVGSAASASASTAIADENLMWSRTNDDVNLFGVKYNPAGTADSFYLYSDYTGGSLQLLSLDEDFVDWQNIYFSEINGSWWAHLADTFVVGGSQQLNLGTDLQFGFFFDTPGSFYTYEKQEKNVYSLQNDTVVVNATDIAPLHAPVPATILLFGSGLLGLVGMKRRKD